jgi:competence protein ComFC
MAEQTVKNTFSEFKGKIGKGLTCFFDLIFPPTCLHCGLQGAWLCSGCLSTLQYRPNQDCLACGKPNEDASLCWICHENAHLKYCWSVYGYRQKPVVSLVKKIKYEFVSQAGNVAGGLLIDFIKEKKIYEKIARDVVVIPVPLHRQRLCWRGFNQSELMAQAVAEHFNWKLNTTSLKRIVSSKPQANLNREERQGNLINHFGCCEIESIKNKHVILIDDVVTTGATMIECAKVLKAAGVKSVSGLALLRG